jgi:hypothetical protein
MWRRDLITLLGGRSPGHLLPARSRQSPGLPALRKVRVHCQHRGTAVAWPTPARGSHQAAALFLIAPMIAVSMAPPAPPAIACEMMPPILRLPDWAAAAIAGSNNVTIWPSSPPPIKPEMMLPIIPRSKVGDDLPAPTPPSAPVTRLIKICSMWVSQLSTTANLSGNNLGVYEVMSGARSPLRDAPIAHLELLRHYDAGGRGDAKSGTSSFA